MMGLRSLRRVAARALPEAIKGRLRGRLYGYRRAACPPAFHLEDEEDGLAAVFAPGMRLRLPLHMRDDIGFYAGSNGASVEEMEGFRRAASETGGLLFDVGAHRAIFANVFCLARPENRAVAYEPSPGLDADGCALAARNGLEERILFRRAAIGAESGLVRGWIDGIGFFHPAGAERQALDEVEMTTIDAECERLGAAPDVMKIDIEGYEDEALAGARDLLARQKPLLFLELHLDLLDARGVPPGEVIGELERHGYRFYTPLGKPLAARDARTSAEAVTRLVAR